MAGTIKGITIQIGADTTKLSSALNTANKSIRETQKDLNAVERALKLNPGNINLLKDKQILLNNKIADTKTKLDALKKAQEQLDSKNVDKNTREYQELQTQINLCEQELQQLEDEQREFGSVGLQKLSELGGKLQDIGGKMEEVGQKLTTKVTLPLAAAGTFAAKKYAEVDKTMQLVNSTMGNSQKEAGKLEKAMKDAASNSTFSMSDAANATLNFARAGLTAEQASDALAPAMNLAAAQGGNLDTVSQGLTATINGFGDSFDNAEQYADIFANACSNSALDVDSLCDSMSTAAPIFKAAGYGVKDATLYMGLMANKGIDANTAANALKTGMARLVSPSKDAKTWMDKLGISVTNADGSMKDTITIQKDLHNAFGKLSDSEKQAAASSIFGKNQMSNWLALIDSSPEEVDKLSKSLDNEKTSSKQAKDMMKGFGGSLEKLKSSIDVAATSFGEALAPTILKVAKAIQGAVDKFNSLSKSQKETIAKVALIVAALGPVFVVVGKIVSTIGTVLVLLPKIRLAMTTISVLMSGTLIPAIGGVIAAIGPLVVAFAPFIAIAAAVVAAGVLIYRNWDTIKAKAIELGKMIATKFNEIKTAIQTKLTEAKTILTILWDTMTVYIQTAMTNIKTFVSTGLEIIRIFFATKIAAAAAIVSSKLAEIKNYFVNRLNEAKTAVSNALEAIKGFFSSKISAAVSTVSSKLAEIKNSFSNRIEEAKTAASNKLEEIKSTISSKVGDIPGLAYNALSNLTKKFKDRFEDAKNAVQDKIDEIKKKFPFDIGKLFKAQVPSISVDWGEVTFAGKTVKYPKKFNVSWNDKGGIFYQPTIIGVGEKRPEFVGALDDLRAIVREESGAGVSAQLMAQMVSLMQELVQQGGKQVTVNQNIYAADTSYSGQQKEAAYQFRQIARAL